MTMITFVILSLLSIDIMLAQRSEEQGSKKTLYYSDYKECDGPESANYTHLAQFTVSSDCRREVGVGRHQLIQCDSNGKKSVNEIQVLSGSIWPNGAYSHAELLLLATGGPLQGTYIYLKVIHLAEDYLKKCSSVLGYSYVSSTTSTLLFNKKLDLNILIAPGGAYEAFKKSATTICQGKAHLF